MAGRRRRYAAARNSLGVRDILRLGVVHGRSPSKTGKHSQLGRWKQQARADRLLLNVKTSQLGAEPELKSMAHVLQRLEIWCPTVLDVAKANQATLLDVPGLGVGRLNKLHDYLTGKGVQLSWEKV